MGEREGAVTVERVAAEACHPLRRAVLRPDGGAVTWPGDDHPDTIHLAARTARGAVVGVVRLSPAPCPHRDDDDADAPWQLRGMATDPAVRGAGVGRALVADGLARVAAAGGDLVWCDARTGAVGFYERMGFTVVTGEFDKPGIGPHVGMLIEVPPRGAGGNRSS